MKNMPILILNSTEEIVGVVSWKRAISLLFKEKVTVPHGYDDYYQIKTVNGYFKLPTALILNSYVKLPYRIASFTRNNIFKRDRYTCQYCGVKLDKGEETIDHIIPRSMGGKNDWKNVVAACYKCNSAKSNKTLQESGYTLLRKPMIPSKNMLLFYSIDKVRNAWTRWI